MGQSGIEYFCIECYRILENQKEEIRKAHEQRIRDEEQQEKARKEAVRVAQEKWLSETRVCSVCNGKNSQYCPINCRVGRVPIGSDKDHQWLREEEAKRVAQEKWISETKVCWVCKGTGSTSPGVSDFDHPNKWDECSHCNGRGRVKKGLFNW
jgi:hypothetical protein